MNLNWLIYRSTSVYFCSVSGPVNSKTKQLTVQADFSNTGTDKLNSERDYPEDKLFFR